MVCAGDGLVGDEDALLGFQLFHEAVDVLFRRDAVGVARDDQAGGRAGGEEGEVIDVRLRGDRDEAFDLRTAHQQLHADPGAEGIAGDPAVLRIGVHGLHPVERGGRIRKFASTMVEFALAAPDATEIEAERRETALLEHVEELVDDLVVHRAAELRMRMQDDGDRGVLFLGRLVATLKTAGRAIENDFGHNFSGLLPVQNREKDVLVLDETSQLF